MGKRTNTILQSAFFALAKVLPPEDAMQYMKDAAEHSYLKKGQDVVQKNWDAIDAGATAFVKIDVPDSWGNPAPDAAEKELAVARHRRDGGERAQAHQQDGRLQPPRLRLRAYGRRCVPQRRLPPTKSAAWPPAWPSGSRRTASSATSVPTSAPHSTIRAFALDEGEQAAAPEGMKMLDFKVGPGKDKYQFAISVSPLDCMGCGVCVNTCPSNALKMSSSDSQMDQQPVFDYCVDQVSVKKDLVDKTVKGSQFNPRCWSSPSCAGCAESTYARLITQLFRRPHDRLQRHRLFLHLGRRRLPPLPPSTRKARVPPG